MRQDYSFPAVFIHVCDQWSYLWIRSSDLIIYYRLFQRGNSYWLVCSRILSSCFCRWERRWQTPFSSGIVSLHSDSCTPLPAVLQFCLCVLSELSSECHPRPNPPFDMSCGVSPYISCWGEWVRCGNLFFYGCVIPFKASLNCCPSICVVVFLVYV